MKDASVYFGILIFILVSIVWIDLSIMIGELSVKQEKTKDNAGHIISEVNAGHNDSPVWGLSYDISKSGNLSHDIGMLTQALETLDKDLIPTMIQCQSLVRDFRRMVNQYDAVEEYPPDKLKRLCSLIHDIKHKIELKTQHDLLSDQLDNVEKVKIRELRAELRGLLAGISYCEEQ